MYFLENRSQLQKGFWSNFDVDNVDRNRSITKDNDILLYYLTLTKECFNNTVEYEKVIIDLELASHIAVANLKNLKLRVGP